MDLHQQRASRCSFVNPCCDYSTHFTYYFAIYALGRARRPSWRIVCAIVWKAAQAEQRAGCSLSRMGSSSEGVACCGARVRYWHKADKSKRLLFVRFRGQSGHRPTCGFAAKCRTALRNRADEND